MKTLKVEKNRAFLYYEMSDKTIDDILTKSQSKLRFDLMYMDDDVDLKKWRGTILKNDIDMPVLEIRDYADNNRKEFALSPQDTVSDASTIALRQIWNWIESHAEEFPPTQAVPVL